MRLPVSFRLQKMPRFVSFDLGMVAGLLGIGIYLAISSRHWVAAAFLALGALWIATIPFRLRSKKADGR